MELAASTFERSMVIVSHVDDECLTYGTLLQRISAPAVVYCTDSAPRDPYFWKERHGSRESYAELRRREARDALSIVGVHDMVFLADMPEAAGRLTDQELFHNLDLAYSLLARLVAERSPGALLTLAYEGGHPDHDSCNFLTAQLSRKFKVPAFEAPIYTRAHSAEKLQSGVQRFIDEALPSIVITPTEAELQCKLRMCAAYPSQGDFLQVFDPRREQLRPLPAYDYSKLPHPGKLNYEVWQWSMTGSEVCAAFSAFLARRGGVLQQAGNQ